MSSRKLRTIFLPGWLALASLLCCAGALAHEVRPAIATIAFADDGQVDLELTLNLEAAIAGIGTDHPSTADSAQAGTYDGLRALPAAALEAELLRVAGDFVAALAVETDAGPVQLRLVAVEVPPTGDPAVARISRLALGGVLPPDASGFRWTFAPGLGDSVIRLRAPGTRKVVESEFVMGGQSSAVLAIARVARR